MANLDEAAEALKYIRKQGIFAPYKIPEEIRVGLQQQIGSRAKNLWEQYKRFRTTGLGKPPSPEFQKLIGLVMGFTGPGPKWITADEILKNPNTIYVFGDNLKELGRGGQAKIARGLKNTLGLPTKKAPSMDASAFFSDRDFSEVKPVIDKVFQKLQVFKEAGKNIEFFPNIGLGYARLNKTAPRIYNYILESIKAFGGK